MYLSEILKVFGATKTSPPGTYFPQGNKKLYMAESRTCVYSNANLIRVISKLQEYIPKFIEFTGIAVVYTIDRLTIIPDPTVPNLVSIYVHNHCHNVIQDSRFEIYCGYQFYKSHKFDNIYSSYEKCLQYCIQRNLSQLHSRIPVKQWLRASKTTITRHTRSVKQLQYYLEKYHVRENAQN